MGGAGINRLNGGADIDPHTIMLGDKSLADALVDIRNAGSPLLWYDEPWE
ncbi:MAG TPA: hypothetical protein P5337_04570 [Aestuariivirga sp.]|nr:hypothetical protein [Aestuariivirga sp.]